MMLLIVLLCGCFGYVFFFKQKTAYEMRISDWSSDVCSSDLSASRIRRSRIIRLVTFEPSRPAIGESLTLKVIARVGGSIGWACSGAATDGSAMVLEIGRASCRERVCQYV